MSVESQAQVRWLLDSMTAIANCPEIDRESAREQIRDMSIRLATQVKSPSMPFWEPPKPFFTPDGHMWL